MKLHTHLVLYDYVSRLLGNDFSGMADSDEGRRPDGQSYFYGYLESRESRLSLSLHDLKRYDLNIFTHQDALAKYRLEFRLKYFQYLTALYTEIYLDSLSDTQNGLIFCCNWSNTAKPTLPNCPPSTPTT